MQRTGKHLPEHQSGDHRTAPRTAAAACRLPAWLLAAAVTAGPALAATGLDWDIAADPNLAEEEKPAVRQAAHGILEDHPDCGSITGGYRSSARKGGYYLTCVSTTTGQPFNLWFTLGESGDELRVEVPRHYDGAAARQLCHSRIRLSVDNPEHLEILYPSSYALREIHNGNTFIIQDIILSPPDAERSIHRARCLVLPDGTVELTIPDRG